MPSRQIMLRRLSGINKQDVRMAEERGSRAAGEGCKCRGSEGDGARKVEGWGVGVVLASFESRHLDENENENDDDDDDDEEESDATMESRFSRCPGRFYIQRPSKGMSFSGAPERETEKDSSSGGKKRRWGGTRFYARETFMNKTTSMIVVIGGNG
ncbi:hypothetical protein K0M31_003479 [Melipona bicolor]|uniref:Uncharacterized protein n=1 Tax=Melipona bicolor TaxID=60889 RepID=A0AA40FZ92_9HYME|nr:hypothetical protein K0M31_003479 [Melipona bicolor]